MMRLALFIDKLSMWVGKAFAWCIMVMTFGVSYEVFVRYFLNSPTSWAFDFSYIMYGTLFMMAGGYALSRDTHVRGDVIYRLWPPRVQATIEFVLYFLFFFPGVFALVYSGWEYALESWGYLEISVMSPANMPVFPFKTVIPVAAAVLFLQGIAQVLRCVICIKTGSWPASLHDVEEMETVLQHKHEDASEVLKGLPSGKPAGEAQ